MKNVSIFTLILGVLVSTQTFAKAALYLSAKSNESHIVDWIKEEDDTHYKIYLNVDGKYKKRIVGKEEISLSTTAEINGHKNGRRALVLNASSLQYEHCYVDGLFENGFMTMFCELLIEGVPHRHYYEGMSTQFTPEIAGPIQNINKGDKRILNKDVGTLKAGTLVRVRFLFANGKIVVGEKLNPVATYLSHGPIEETYSVIVGPSDLSPVPEN